MLVILLPAVNKLHRFCSRARSQFFSLMGWSTPTMRFLAVYGLRRNCLSLNLMTKSPRGCHPPRILKQAFIKSPMYCSPRLEQMAAINLANEKKTCQFNGCGLDAVLLGKRPGTGKGLFAQRQSLLNRTIHTRLFLRKVWNHNLRSSLPSLMYRESSSGTPLSPRTRLFLRRI